MVHSEYTRKCPLMLMSSVVHSTLVIVRSDMDVTRLSNDIPIKYGIFHSKRTLVIVRSDMDVTRLSNDIPIKYGIFHSKIH